VIAILLNAMEVSDHKCINVDGHMQSNVKDWIPASFKGGLDMLSHASLCTTPFDNAADKGASIFRHEINIIVQNRRGEVS
jgi:hypothetical protein